MRSGWGGQIMKGLGGHVGTWASTLGEVVFEKMSVMG